MLASDRISLARAISAVESLDPRSPTLLDLVHHRLGHGTRLGITGPPGAGKSTLVTRLARAARADGERVGIVAVDPTSPFTGGALLGDRVRMAELALDADVFIRSMATRGSMGGLARATEEVADLLEAAGYERTFIETVGVGQSEIDIAGAADTTLVVLVPESGDGVQTMKAGLMEIADVFAVNKADRGGADALAAEIEVMLSLRDARSDWRPPVVRTVGTAPDGLGELWSEVRRHERWLRESGRFEERRRARLTERIRQRVRERVLGELWTRAGVNEAIDRAVTAVETGTAAPYAAADAIAAHVLAAAGEVVAQREGDR